MLEQAEHLALCRQGLEAGQVVDVAPVLPPAEPLRHEVALVLAVALEKGLLHVRDVRWQEHRSAPAQHHIDAIAVGELHQLRCDVRADALGVRRHGGFPVAVGGVRVGGGRGRVGDAGGADDAGLQVALFGFFEQRRQLVLLLRRTIAAFDLRADADDASARSLAGDQRRHRARRVRHLGIDVVRLHQRDVREVLKGEQIFFPLPALVLAVKDPRRGYRGNTHAVADEENHVARCIVGRARLECEGEEQRKRRQFQLCHWIILCVFKLPTN